MIDKTICLNETELEKIKNLLGKSIGCDGVWWDKKLYQETVLTLSKISKQTNTDFVFDLFDYEEEWLNEIGFNSMSNNTL